MPAEFIKSVRDRGNLDENHIRQFIAGIGTGATSDAQIGAFTMAVVLKEMDIKARTALTCAMRDSGEVLQWDLPGPVLDKHSTGGVGDNVSLILGPVIAACGGFVPMISGRGLGHTGGTLDKFESIPGYNTHPDNTTFKNTVRDIGCAIIGQTGSLAPADSKIYAIRSVTATVDSVSLITASILSKKLAAGLEHLMLDIKCGSGAIMDNIDDARTLAKSLIGVGNGAGMPTTGIITDMNEPLASAAGNALEMRNAIDFLSGVHRDKRLGEVVEALCAHMLVAAKLSPDVEHAKTQIDHVLTSGQALDVFAHMVSALGGPKDLTGHLDTYLESAPLIADIAAPETGWVSAIDTRSVGMAVIVLGGGRKRPADKIDFAVGFDAICPVGHKVEKGEPLARIHARDPDTMQIAQSMLQNAYTISGDIVENPSIIEVL
ncbi:MAG TPA: thymidine phosphorylase [Hellea balneolensis]|uniref:Thymidine phosphorylase n=1 Tax=Hellea balneolensis TaxID=287478 RepID=A0A7C5R161_9PROT|nr:thymidine phosphorylase [Hellea balneolensis]